MLSATPPLPSGRQAQTTGIILGVVCGDLLTSEQAQTTALIIVVVCGDNGLLGVVCGDLLTSEQAPRGGLWGHKPRRPHFWVKVAA
jgi:hypothetical protein